MKKSIRNMVIYCLTVLVPTIIASLFYINYEVKEDLNKRKDYTKWVASIHETHWNQLISEIVTSLDILSLSTETMKDEPKRLEDILKRASQADPRYGGMYLLDASGHIITGSNTHLRDGDFSKKPYVKEVIQTKDVIISDSLETLENGQQVIGLAEPVLDNNKNSMFVIVSLLRVDYIHNVMKVLTPDTQLYVLNSKEQVIMDINMDGAYKGGKEDWLSTPINRLPWSIQVKIPEANNKEIFKNSLVPIIIFFIISHILYLLGKYLLLKRQANQQKKQNEAQKLELVGTLAASTAHEIRNPLTGIKGLVQLLSEKHRDPEDQFYFSVIDDEIKRINLIVSEFLILGKPTVQKTEVCDLRLIIEDLQPLIFSEANLFNVYLNTTMPSYTVNVNCTKDQMKQVILNITKNAFESMSTGGKLNIELVANQHECQINITDTGAGIPKEDLERIFHPFYTSKETGTGLGLVVCKRIIESFGGTIRIFSNVNEGTQVELTLPLVQS